MNSRRFAADGWLIFVKEKQLKMTSAIMRLTFIERPLLAWTILTELWMRVSGSRIRNQVIIFFKYLVSLEKIYLGQSQFLIYFLEVN